MNENFEDDWAYFCFIFTFPLAKTLTEVSTTSPGTPRVVLLKIVCARSPDPFMQIVFQTNKEDRPLSENSWARNQTTTAPSSSQFQLYYRLLSVWNEAASTLESLVRLGLSEFAKNNNIWNHFLHWNCYNGRVDSSILILDLSRLLYFSHCSADGGRVPDVGYLH